MNPRSAKNKGDRFENWLVELFRERLDKTTHRNYGSGAGLDKNDIRLPAFNIEIEAKNTEKIHLIEDWDQVKRQRTQGNVGVLAIRNPKKPEFQEVMIVIDIGDFIDMAAGVKGEVNIINNQDRELQWAIKGLKEACNKVMRKLGE